MRPAVRFLVLVPVVVCAACGGSGSAKVTQDITGGTKAERSLAREVLSKLEPSPVSSVVFRGYQHDAIHHWPGRRMDVTGGGASGDDGWQEYIFGYSYAVVARVRHIPIGFVAFDLGFGSLDNALAHAPRKPIDDTELRAFETKLQVVAKTAHARVRFRELRPGPVALEATYTTSKPLALVRQHIASLKAPQALFGFLLEISLPSGEVAFTEGSSPGGGTTSADPKLLGCFLPYMHFTGPPQTMIPPCPA